MPPKTRGNRGAKILKENVNVIQKTITKHVTKAAKVPRKVLADKTNSASDDNASLLEVPKKVTQKPSLQQSKQNNISKITTSRPRRERRLPPRYEENNVLKNLSNNKNDVELPVSVPEPKKTKTPVKNTSITISPIKTPQNLENSLIVNRPKRVSRLPSKFDDHFISPGKNVPVQPCHASTPILQSKDSKNSKFEVQEKRHKVNKEINKTPQKRRLEGSTNENSDTNNNAKRIRTRKQQKDIIEPTKVPEKKTTTVISKPKILNKVCPSKPIPGKKLQDISFSFRVLEDEKQSPKVNNDIYEFTFDPNEEPAPVKKKRKKAVRKKPPQSKFLVFKNNYDKNLSKALAALKTVVSKKPEVQVSLENLNNQPVQATVAGKATIENNSQSMATNKATIVKNNTQSIATDVANAYKHSAIVNEAYKENTHNSVQVEDIAADFDVSLHDDINYSPVNSPQAETEKTDGIPEKSHDKDPLNLQDDISFFDHPVASSSMNMSVRHPQASPWRVEFGELPIKWPVNSYVKANMTPAVESSFINFNDNKKKHVYTNMVPVNDMPEVQNQPNLKQTSIISFIREVVERSAQKKKKGKAVTPVKNNSIFEDITNSSITVDKTPKNAKNAVQVSNDVVEDVSNNSSLNKENSNEDIQKKKTKTSKNKDDTFFGFDESEDQENMSPIKDNPKVRALRPRARAVLQEINAVSGPMRLAVPVAAKSKVVTNSDVNKVYEELAATDAPVFPEKNVEVTNIDDATYNSVNDDSQSVHLFEDIEVVHHLKPMRKSYGKAKKVTFQQHSTLSGEERNQVQANVSSEEDDLADLTFTMPSVQQKKTKKKVSKKQKMSKKEEQALEAWAAGFNSMCEDIDEFPLVVE